ncbi:MAG: S8 family serine peptidase [Blastocatellia bacterium]|nr:S8 family serine peptidase [Blastocatellia bacterium]
MKNAIDGKMAREITRNSRRLFSIVRFLALAVCLTVNFCGISLLSISTAHTNAAARPGGEGQGIDLPATALQQMRELWEEKSSRSPDQQKIDSQLLTAYKKRQGLAISRSLESLRTDVLLDKRGKTLVDIKAKSADGLIQSLKSTGVEILDVVNTRIRARIDLADVERIASMPQIVSIRPADRFTTGSLRGAGVNSQPPSRSGPDGRADRLRSDLPKLISRIRRSGNPGSQAAAQMFSPAVKNTSEGDEAHRADEARDFYGYDGTGVKIGVLSNGVDSLVALQNSGDLPPNVTVLPDQQGEGDEGSAMLEIVHDLVPGAQLFFASAAGGIARFAQNIKDLRFVHGCDIIVDDVFYLAESSFQDGQTEGVNSPLDMGLIAQAVNDVTDDGALYFSSAGNGGNKNGGTSSTWEGNFNSANTFPDLHLFGANTPNNQMRDADAIVIFQWSDSLGTSANDYDLFIFNSSLTAVVAASLDIQDGDDDPIEGTCVLAGEQIVIASFDNNLSSRFLSIRAFGGAEFNINTEGSTVGHSTVANAFGVGAVAVPDATTAANLSKVSAGVFDGSEDVEPFSSDGPRHLFYQADGTAITPGNFLSSGGLIRQKPDISAANRVTTAAPGFETFAGTSAAAPHAAAIAALLLSADRALPSPQPSINVLSPGQVRTALLSSALDVEATGADRDTGAGIVMAVPAMQAINAIPLPRIDSVSLKGKKNLLIEGEHFNSGSKVLVHGTEQKTKRQSSTSLIAKKAAKGLSSGQTVVVQVRNGNGLLSRNQFSFTRP